MGGVSGAGRELEGVSKAPCIPLLTPGASPQVQPWGQVTQRMSLRMGHPGLRTPVMGHATDGSPQALLTLGHHRTSLPQVTLWDRSPMGPGDPPPAGGKAGTWDTGCNPCQRPWGPTLGVPTGILGCSAVLTPSSSPSSKQSEEAGPGGALMSANEPGSVFTAVPAQQKSINLSPTPAGHPPLVPLVTSVCR